MHTEYPNLIDETEYVKFQHTCLFHYNVSLCYLLTMTMNMKKLIGARIDQIKHLILFIIYKYFYYYICLGNKGHCDIPDVGEGILFFVQRMAAQLEQNNHILCCDVRTAGAHVILLWREANCSDSKSINCWDSFVSLDREQESMKRERERGRGTEMILMMSTSLRNKYI